MRKWIPILFSTVVLSGCSDDGGGGSSSASGVESGKGLSAVSDAERQKLCDYMASSMSPSQQSTCLMAGVTASAFIAIAPDATDASLQSACQTLYDNCMQSAPQPVTTTETCEPVDGTCTATVGEFEACGQELAAAMEGLYAVMPQCSALTVAYFQQDTEMPSSEPEISALSSESAACSALQQKCPGALDSGGDPTAQFDCADGSGSVASSLVCDGGADCGDGSDELGCSNSGSTSFICADGVETVPADWTCDGEADCDDGSDELNCT